MASDGMRRIKLKDVCDRITVGHVGPMAEKYTAEGVPFLRSQNITPFRLNLNDIKFIPPDFHEKLRKSALQPGDVAVVRTGYPGTACVIPNTYTKLNCADLVVITPSQKLNPYYLAAIFNSAWGVASVAGNLVGVAQQHFNIGAARELEISLPPRPTQDRIAGILSTYDELMENSHRRIRILEEMARALYREWFVHFRFPGHDRKDCSVGILGDICDLAKDPFDEAIDSELPLLDLAHIPSHSLAPQETGKASELTTSRIAFRQGDTLFGAIRSYLHKVVIAPYPGVTNVSVLVLRPKRPEFRAIVAIGASSADTIRWTDQHSTGTKMPVINGSVFTTMPVSVPTLRLAAQFERIAGPMLDELCLLSVRNQNLRRTRDLLLPRLLSGQLRLTEVAA